MTLSWHHRELEHCLVWRKKHVSGDHSVGVEKENGRVSLTHPLHQCRSKCGVGARCTKYGTGSGCLGTCTVTSHWSNIQAQNLPQSVQSLQELSHSHGPLRAKQASWTAGHAPHALLYICQLGPEAYRNLRKRSRSFYTLSFLHLFSFLIKLLLLNLWFYTIS